MSIQYYGLASDEELPEEFCAIRHEHGEPSEYHWYVPEPRCETDETGCVTRVEIDGRWYVPERTCEGEMDYDGWFVCSECGCKTNGDQYGELPNYCSNCGARIEVQE